MQPARIAAGPDGNLWFPMNNGIDRLTPAGDLTEFRSGFVGAPAGITAGPDGTLWYDYGNGGQFGRISISGAVSEFARSLPSGICTDSITPSPDRNVWLAWSACSIYPAGSGFARITQDGDLTLFSTSAEDIGAGITAGPDGDPWFTLAGGARIGRITPDGAVATVYGGGSSPNYSHGIVTDGSGSVWFTEPVTGRISRLVNADVNGDGAVGPVDALCLLRAVGGLPATPACPAPLPHPDVNLDGTTAAVDALCLLRYVAGLPATPSLPAGPRTLAALVPAHHAVEQCDQAGVAVPLRR